MAKSTATLTDNETGKSYEMPIIHGTLETRYGKPINAQPVRSCGKRSCFLP